MSASAVVSHTVLVSARIALPGTAITDAYRLLNSSATIGYSRSTGACSCATVAATLLFGTTKKCAAPSTPERVNLLLQCVCSGLPPLQLLCAGSCCTQQLNIAGDIGWAMR
jgi:hypothetical protein